MPTDTPLRHRASPRDLPRRPSAAGRRPPQGQSPGLFAVEARLARRQGASAPPLVLSGHAASLSPYQSDTPRPSPRPHATASSALRGRRGGATGVRQMRDGVRRDAHCACPKPAPPPPPPSDSSPYHSPYCTVVSGSSIPHPPRVDCSQDPLRSALCCAAPHRRARHPIARRTLRWCTCFCATQSGSSLTSAHSPRSHESCSRSSSQPCAALAGPSRVSALAHSVCHTLCATAQLRPSHSLAATLLLRGCGRVVPSLHRLAG